MKNQYQEIPAKVNHTAYALAMKILETLEIHCTAEATAIASESLRGMLYAKELKLLALHTEKLRLFLNMLIKNADESQQAALQYCLWQLNNLKIHREYHLNHWFSYLQFWSAKQWPHQNLLFLVVPLIIGIFVPIVGIAALIFLVIYTAISLADLGVQSESYWQWQDLPMVTEEPFQDDSQEGFNEQLSILLARPKESYINRRLNDILYYGDIIAIAICIIALISLLFPPIGIPVLALSVLTGLALFIGGAQWLAVMQQQAQERAESEYLEVSATFDESSKWFKSHRLTPNSSEEFTSQHGQAVKADRSNWLMNPLTWYKNKSPASQAQFPSTGKPQVLSWILNMMKWQSAEAPRELEMICRRKHIEMQDINSNKKQTPS